jgi:serine/threonine protein kinase
VVAELEVPGYTGLKALGSGGFGDVILAVHDASGVLVAIKYLRPDLLADREFAEMFRSEAVVLGSLDDPDIVRLYEYVESPSGAAIVMELIDGVSLREILIHQGSTTAEAALVVLQGSLMGLAAAHQRGVVHRDYKPANVLVNGDGVSKLTDFGLAVRAGDRPVPAGTLLYVAPEQIAGAPASPAGDVYSATATFYECLAGSPPFSGESAELLRQHQAADVPLDPVPGPLRPLVAAGMAKDPWRRPADAISLVTELRMVASDAYGRGWEERGRSHLGEAALLLAALWPSAAAPAVQGAAVHQIPLFDDSGHGWHVRHVRHVRHIRPVTVAMVAGTAATVVAVSAAFAATSQHAPPVPNNHPVVAVHPVSLQPSPSTSPSKSPSPSPSPSQTLPPPPTTAPPTTTPPTTTPPTTAPPTTAPPTTAPPTTAPPTTSPPTTSPPTTSPPTTTPPTTAPPTTPPPPGRPA